MSTTKNEVKVAIATLILVTYALSLSVLTQVTSSLQANSRISNTGSLKAVGVGVYWDAALTNRVSSIDWGIMEPGSSVDKIVYIRNEGNTASSLSMTTSNWSPSNASNYITLKWNYGGQTLNVNEVVQVKFTLSILSSISGITNFSFDITITTSG